MENATLPQCHANRILAALPPASLERLSANLEVVSMPQNATIHSAHKALDAIYFPVNGFVSFSNSDNLRRSAAVALTGNEGFIGVGLALRNARSIHNAVTLCEAAALRLPWPNALEALADDEFRALALRSVHAFLAQVSFNSICERLHTVEQRLMRWLLLTSDRVFTEELPLTQDRLAALMGVRREAVTIAAANLQKAELIKYQRGKVLIVDRVKLDSLACQCYREIHTEYALLFKEVL